MIFLGPLYHWLTLLLANHVNHFPLVRLVVFSLDKTLLYLIAFGLGQWLYVRFRRQQGQKVHWPRVVGHFIFVGYLVLLIHLTVLRYDWQWWHLTLDDTRSLARFHLIPLLDTFKLEQGESPFSFWYNFLGNVVWFIPFGILVPYLRHQRFQFFTVVGWGLLLSVGIELGQYFLGTGVTHIDDVLFNVSGVVIGYVFYDSLLLVKRLLAKGETHADIGNQTMD
ncbi:MAG: VanZ family protein [Aerococcus sp.]|nr:VanZ family protein [Aerococcus sp.]